MGLLELFGLKGAPAQAESKATSETVRRITEQLDQMEPARAKYIAAFAYLLGRVAHADLTISEHETREMERIVQNVAGLPEEQAILVVQIAKAQHTLFGSTENFVVTEEFARLATRAQKLSLLNCLFAVSSSDRSISTIEDNEIRKVSRELRLDHSDFIAARSAYKEHLEVLKKRPER
jgi:uncharacterized tellurite resistance protein B-like protein